MVVADRSPVPAKPSHSPRGRQSITRIPIRHCTASGVTDPVPPDRRGRQRGGYEFEVGVGVRGAVWKPWYGVRERGTQKICVNLKLKYVHFCAVIRPQYCGLCP